MGRIDNKLIDDLRSEYGTPFYIMFPARFRMNLNHFLNAFKKEYDNTIISYSFKTNYLPALCEIARKEGCYAEVVSEMELDLADKLHFENIIFNGPIKKDFVLEKAIEKKAIINLDADYEVDYICNYKKAHPNQTLSVGLRLNVQIQNEEGMTSVQSGLKHGRFGFPHSILKDAINKLRNAGIHICSLHGHSSSSDRAVLNFEIITKYMLSVRKEFQLNDVRYFDIGGGFFGAAPEGLNISGKPTYENYAHAVLSILYKDSWFLNARPFIVIEPGSSVVSNVFEYYTSIYQLKTIGTKHFAIVDGTVFDVKPTMHSYNLPFSLMSFSNDKDRGQEKLEFYDVVGSTCMEKDIIMHDVSLPYLNKNDIFQIRGVGAYTISLTPTFINFLAPIISVEKNDVVLVRRRQNIEDVLNVYKL